LRARPMEAVDNPGGFVTTPPGAAAGLILARRCADLGAAAVRALPSSRRMEGRSPRAETQVGTQLQRTGGVAFDEERGRTRGSVPKLRGNRCFTVGDRIAGVCDIGPEMKKARRQAAGLQNNSRTQSGNE